MAIKQMDEVLCLNMKGNDGQKQSPRYVTIGGLPTVCPP